MESRAEVEFAEALLVSIAGLDPSDPQERDTAKRFVKAMRELTTSEPFEFTTFDSPVRNMVIEKDMEFSSLCRHHVLPFMGTCHLGYVPNGKIAGISKIPRLVQQVSSALWTQEELTERIVERFVNFVDPLGVIVVMEAKHTCMSMRGARATGSTVTSSVYGVFAEHDRTAKMEFMEAIR